MFYYHAFGLDISSEIELPGILEKDNLKIVDIHIKTGPVNLPKNFDKSNNYLVQNEDVFLWWDEIGKVKISNGEEIIVDVFEESIIPIILGPVMSLLLYKKGFLVLHGSAIKVDQFAVAFLGYCGFGKSTLAINLYNKGYPLVTDDIVAIKFNENNEAIIFPGYHHVRLSEDSYNNIKDNENIVPLCSIVGKLFCDASIGFTPEPLKLERIYLLENGDKTKIYNLNSQDNLLDLITHSTAKHFISSKEQADNLYKCSKLINNIVIKGLKVNHSFTEINELIEVIEQDLNLK